MTAGQLSAHYDKIARRLVKAHRELKDEPLVLAAMLDSADSKDLVLLEVIENFPGAPDDDLFITEMPSSHDVPILGKLRMILGNMSQLKAALRRRDELIFPRSKGAATGVVLFPPKSGRRAKVKKLIKDLRLDG